jgi:hypothetical protein
VENRTIYVQTLQLAADLIGDIDVLAALLRAQRAELLHWLAGKSMPPTAAFLRAVDIVNNQERMAEAQLKAGDVAKLKKAG